MPEDEVAYHAGGSLEYPLNTQMKSILGNPNETTIGIEIEYNSKNGMFSSDS